MFSENKTQHSSLYIAFVVQALPSLRWDMRLKDIYSIIGDERAISVTERSFSIHLTVFLVFLFQPVYLQRVTNLVL